MWYELFSVCASPCAWYFLLYFVLAGWLGVKHPNYLLASCSGLIWMHTCNFFPVSPQDHAPWQPTSWPLVVMSGDARTRTQATTPRVTSPRTTSVCRCCCRTGSLASSWCQTRGHGTTTSWVSCHSLVLCAVVSHPFEQRTSDWLIAFI